MFGSGNILSIDAGLKGAAVVFSKNGEVISTIPFKKQHIKEVGKGTKMFVRNPISICNIEHIIIEDQQPRPNDTPKTAYTVASLFSSLVVHLQTSYPNATFHFIKPHTWQAFIRKESDAVFLTSKETSIHFAKKHLSNKELIPKNCRKPHDGIADAFCLGYFFINKKS